MLLPSDFTAGGIWLAYLEYDWQMGQTVQTGIFPPFPIVLFQNDMWNIRHEYKVHYFRFVRLAPAHFIEKCFLHTGIDWSEVFDQAVTQLADTEAL